MSTPTDLKYSKSHEWVRIEGDEAVIGITQFAQDALGDLTYADTLAEGEELSIDGECGSLESVKAASDLYSPVAGTITAVNGELADHPEIINSDPYGKGWIYRVKVSEVSPDLLDAQAYDAHCASESH